MLFANVGIFFFGEEGGKKQKPEETKAQIWNKSAELERCGFVPRICKWEVCLFEGAC